VGLRFELRALYLQSRYVLFLNHTLYVKAHYSSKLTFIDFLSCKFANYILASEDFFDKLTVEQEFMSGIDTDKVCREYNCSKHKIISTQFDSHAMPKYF
jgi:hypothetical protein